MESHVPLSFISLLPYQQPYNSVYCFLCFILSFKGTYFPPKKSLVTLNPPNGLSRSKCHASAISQKKNPTEKGRGLYLLKCNVKTTWEEQDAYPIPVFLHVQSFPAYHHTLHSPSVSTLASCPSVDQTCCCFSSFTCLPN